MSSGAAGARSAAGCRGGAGRRAAGCGQAGQGTLPGGDALAGQHAEPERERLRRVRAGRHGAVARSGRPARRRGRDLAGIRAGTRATPPRAPDRRWHHPQDLALTPDTAPGSARRLLAHFLRAQLAIPPPGLPPGRRDASVTGESTAMPQAARHGSGSTGIQYPTTATRGPGDETPDSPLCSHGKVRVASNRNRLNRTKQVTV